MLYYFKNVLHIAICVFIIVYCCYFLGLAGVIYFLLDIQQPYLTKFPTYDI